MADNGTEMHGADQRELYETHAQQLRQRIAQLITSYAEIEAEAEDLRPTADDDLQRLDQLEARIRNNITDLRPLSVQYDHAVAEWNQLDQTHGIMTSDSPWTRSMFAFRKKCINAKSNQPTLPTKVMQLLVTYNGMLADIAGLRDHLGNDNADHHSPLNPGYLVQTPPSVAGSRTTHSVGREPPRRVQFAVTAHSAEATNHRGNPVANQPPPASDSTPFNQLMRFNPLRVFELAWRHVPSFGFGTPPPPVQTPTSYSASTTPAPTPATVYSPRSATLSTPGSRSSVAAQQPTPVPRTNLRRAANGVPIVTQLNHGDDTPVTDTYRTTTRHTTHGHSSDGVFISSDPHGNIHNTRPMAWESTYIPTREDRQPSRSLFYSDGTSAAPAAAPRSRVPPQSDAAPTGSRPHSGPAPTGPTPHSGETTTRLEDYELPPYVPPTRAPTTAEVDRMATDFASLAAGRGSEDSPRITTPLTTDTEPAALSAAMSSAPSRSTTTAASKEAETAFYRNSRFVRRTYPDIALPSNLVLKALPLKTFEGDVRSYPEFRDNFLELIESQPHLSPQQKLQYLVNHLKGAPLQMAEGFGFSEGSYFEVIELLEARYGDEIVLQNLLLQDLVALSSPAARPSDLEAFHRDALQIYQRLKRAGMDMDENPVCNQLLLGKLPHTIKLKALEKADEKGRVSTSVQLKEILTHLNSLQRAQTAGLTLVAPPSKGTNVNRSRPNSRPTSPRPHSGHSGANGSGGSNQRPNYYGTYVADTEYTYAASKQQLRQLCAFCGGPHWAARCTVYATVRQREERVRVLKQCFVCLGRGHWGQTCPNRRAEPCKCCQQRQHHVALCWDYMHGGRPKSPRQTPVNQQPISGGGTGAHQPKSGGDCRDQPIAGGGTVSSRRSPSTSVNGQGAGGGPGTNVPLVKPMCNPSAQNSQESGSGNSTSNRKKQQKRPRSNNKKGTDSSRQNGTTCHAADASDENTIQKSGEACSGAGLLAGHQALLQTDRCSNPSDFAALNGGLGGSTAAGWQPYTRDDEEISLPESTGHCSNPDPDEFEGIDDQYWYPSNDGYAVSESAPADSQAVLLECIKVTAVNPTTGASREATAFFDNGSSLTFVSTELANDLNLPHFGPRKIRVNVFAADKASLIDGFATSLVLRSPQGQEVHIDATASDHGVKSVRTALVTRDELPLLQNNACTLISTRERPDILIGQDKAQLFKRRYGTDLPNGFYVVHTVLGPLVGGVGRATTEESKDVHVAATPGENDTLCQAPLSAVIDIMDRSTSRPAPPRTDVPSQGNTTSASTTYSVGRQPQDLPQTTYFVEEVPRTFPEETVSGYLSGLVDKSDAELLGDFSFLENAGMGTYEMKPDDQAAADMLTTTHKREPDGRFNVPLLFRTANGEPPSNEELPANRALGKGRAISTRNTLAKDPNRLADYHEIVLNYKALGFIGVAPRVSPYTKHCLSHHPVFKETSTTTATRPVFDASAKLPGRTCLNDWVFRGPVLLPTVPAILLRSRFPTIIVVSDIGKAFLQVSVKESHRDCLRWFWFKDPFAEPTDDNLIEYRFNRVPFGLKSAPYLLAGVIKLHLENEGTPLALEMLKNCYVDNVLLMADTLNEALVKYRDSKAIFAKIQMPLREYASNNAAFNAAIDQADRADLEKLRELGIRWDVTADYWDIPLRPKPPSTTTHSVENDATSTALVVQEEPTSSVKPTIQTTTKKPKRKRGKKADDNRLTKRTMLRFVAQIFDPMGLVQAILLLAKLVIQEVWKIEKDWDDEVPDNLAKLWYEAIKDFDQTTIRIPRRIALGKIKSVEIHVFTDGSSQAYGFTAYLRVKDSDGRYRSNLVFARARVKPIKDAEKYTIPRMELLGALVGARAIKFLHQEICVMITATHLWSDSTIVLHQIADEEKIKDIWVENRLLEIRQVRGTYNVQFRHVPTADNPADIVSRGMAASELQNCSKWWFGPTFLSQEATLWPSGPSSLTERTNSVPPPNSDLDKYGPSSFAALYVEAFTPEERIPKRKLRSRRKPNPLDTITEPLPTTTVSAYAVALVGQTTNSVATIPPLPSKSILPKATEDKYPQWTRQVRITYYVLRFAAAYLRRIRERLRQERLRQRKKVAFKHVFTPSLGFDLADHFVSPRPNLRDLNITELIMLRKTQLRHPPSSADRRNLGIFEHQGLLYVKGRLGNMKMRPSALTPLYLPKEAKETALIITNYHRINCHSGVQATLANIRMKYWFTSGRKTVQRAIYKNCFPCRRETLHPYASPPWPQLPTTRVTQARPFLCTGLDFFGPCLLRTPHPQGGFELKKHYVAIFVCMTYRCVHLELCSDLSTEQFLHALRRFGSRREYPARILSDNGASFLTARQVINQIRQNHAPAQAVKRPNPVRRAVSVRLSAKGQTTHSVESSSDATKQPTPTQPTLTPEEERLIDFCQKHQIEWQTITELSPWRGGVYERLIGLIKHCLRRSIGRSKPTTVEFSSLLAEAERTANSRPLSYIADSDTDFFLVRPLDILHPLLREEVPQNPLDPPIDVDCDPNDADFVAPGENRLHAKVIQGLKKSRRAADTFWFEFRDGYLADLRNRGVNRKNHQYGEPTVQLGDLVLIKESDVPRCDWRLALVTELIPDQDGLIRTARVHFSRTHQEHTRALEHLYPIGNVPRVPTRCDTTAFIDVYSISVLSDSETVEMAPTTPTAATTEPTTTGQEDLDNTEATTQPTASATTHSVEEAVQAQGQPPMPPTTIGTEFSAEDIPALQARSDAIFEAIISSLRAAKDASDAQTRDAILLNMAKTTSDLLVAGPRADHDQGKKIIENGPAPSETTHSVDKLDDKKGEPSDAATEHQADHPAEEPPKPTAEAEEQPAPVPLTEFVNAQLAPEATTAPEPALQSEVSATATEAAQQPQAEPSSRTIRQGPANYQFRGRGRALQMRTNATPRPAYQPQPDNNDPTPSPEAEPQAKAEDSTESVKAPTDADTQPETTNSVEPPQAVETPDAPTKANDGFCNSFFPSQERPAASAATTHSVEAPQAPAAPAPTPPAATGDEDLVPAQPLLDLSVLPGYPAKEEVLRQMNRCFTEEVRGTETILKVHEQLLSSTSVPEPQQTGFGFNRLLQDGRPSGHIWDPPTTCDGQGENCHRFHQSLLVFRIIIKTTWKRYTVISTSPQLQGLLDHVLTLHVRCFGQMILLVYAVRLGNNRGQMKPILHFIRDMLKTTDFAFKIPHLLNHYHKKMTIGLSDREDPRPNGDDFSLAAQYWLCYCHRAFASFIEGLSGFLSWNAGDWLQTEELDAHLRTAIREKILTPAPQLLQQLRDRAYRQYVLLRIQALERNDVSYRWIRLSDAPKDDGTNDYLHVKRVIGKTVLFVSEDLFELPITKLLNNDVQLVRIDSTNRASVLGTIRSYLPGLDTHHAVFWFGRQYINNGNEDYGNVIAEICFHYTTFFGRVRQSIILPPYNRVHRQVWTGQVLCFYTQKDRIAPHAQVVLNSYDARLWFEDQRLLDNGQDLPRWKNSNQDADGAFYKAGALEFRKHHLREYHQIKLWSWYQVDHVGENPPTDQRRAPRRPATPPITPHSGDGDFQAAAAASTSASSTAAAAPDTTGPSGTNPPAPIVNIFGERALAQIIEHVAHQATMQIVAVLDAKLSHIEAMLMQQMQDSPPNDTAEDRQQDSDDEP